MKAPEYRERGPIVEVSFRYDGQGGQTWNTELYDYRRDVPMRIPLRAVDDASFSADYLKDVRQLEELRDFRDRRRRVIEGHFMECANKMIESIEEKEEWSRFNV